MHIKTTYIVYNYVLGLNRREKKARTIQLYPKEPVTRVSKMVQ